ncbi:DNA methyltransferase [Flexilinea flocculi]|uniref:DNA methylase n=1 Tax=Flexilinea flocculi TaxID=1678840 RepID=A0A0S7BK63_9CHLR|nr:DNA methyltransferase [Flexilinea flocculi]GAP40682.1 DNA methylase [Flexilinea flocculi]
MTEYQPELIPPKNSALTPEEQTKCEEYRQRLAAYLKDPAFRAIEGFPIGTDEDILALSDPPYYTACPNPFLLEILSQWQQEREEIRSKLGLKEEKYQREPFAADVSEGKNDPIYNAHSYHTKVPHKAIMRYILHYTDPGDIVFDGFCGTGMTGVAAQLCGDKKTVESLGYRVDDQGVIWEGEKVISRLGARKAVLNDLSPAATFIAYNYNTPVDAVAFEHEARRILCEVEQECGWMYETWHPNCDDPNRVKGKINYTVWSDIFVCPNCGQEMAFWDETTNPSTGVVTDTWSCPRCSSLLGKNPSKECGALKAEYAWTTFLDKETNNTVRQVKQVPVLISYHVGKKRFEKKPDNYDLEIIDKISNQKIPYGIPTERMPEGSESRRNDDTGLTHVHHYYSRRNLWILAKIQDSIFKKNTTERVKHYLEIWFTSSQSRLHKLNRYMFEHHRHVGPLSGTLYVSSTPVEISPFYFVNEKLEDHLSVQIPHNKKVISTNSSTRLKIPEESIDYIFVDPPFGSNLNYSELNFLIESWIKVITNSHEEAIINKYTHKLIPQYAELMTSCFSEFIRILKSGGWITVEFHNSQNQIWNVIQESLQKAYFIVADVRVLDKQKGTTKQLSTTGAVKQDLIISAYKPNGNLEECFKLKAGTEDGAWEFVRYHLGKLPVTNESNGVPAVNAERQAFLLFDRMVAFHVQRGVMVPLSALEFYAGLEQRFTRRDGMYFLPDQVAEYDRAMLNAKKPVQLTLFVNDEKTAITWLHQQLDSDSGGEPKTQGDLTNDFNRVMNRAKHEQPLELIEILKQNFLQDTEGKWYVPDHNKASDLEKVRQRALLKEFKEYTESTGRLKVFRSEAVRAGFAACFKRQDYQVIVRIAERLPEDVLREDPDLLMYYDSAQLRKG